MAALTGAGVRDFDGIEYEELEFNEVGWPDPSHIEDRSRRKHSPSETDIRVSLTAEAVRDPRAWIGPGNSRSGDTVMVVGFSQTAGRALTVLVRPVDRPPAGRCEG